MKRVSIIAIVLSLLYTLGAVYTSTSIAGPSGNLPPGTIKAQPARNYANEMDECYRDGYYVPCL